MKPIKILIENICLPCSRLSSKEYVCTSLEDIEAIPADQLGRTGIALTIAGGRVTHDPAAMAGEGR